MYATLVINVSGALPRWAFDDWLGWGAKNLKPKSLSLLRCWKQPLLWSLQTRPRFN